VSIGGKSVGKEKIRGKNMFERSLQKNIHLSVERGTVHPDNKPSY
jgi:hypothetical protein